MNNDKRIEAYLIELKGLYADIPEEQKAFIYPLIENVAFMRVTLENLQKVINEEEKASSELQAYNQLIKNYSSAMEKLQKLLPENHKQDVFFEKILWGGIPVE